MLNARRLHRNDYGVALAIARHMVNAILSKIVLAGLHVFMGPTPIPVSEGEVQNEESHSGL